MLISREMIRINIDVKDKEEVIQTVAALMDQAGKLFDREKYVQAIFQRESEMSTNMGDRIAMPHGRSPYVKEAGLVFLRLKNEILWEGMDGEATPVSLIFGIAAPESGGDMHLRILASLARKLIYDEFKQKLFAVESEEELLTILEEATGGLG